jgi:hypothetical protein
MKMNKKMKQTTTFNFENFYKKFENIYPNLIKPDKSFLEWFIGFTEGEGSFILAKRGDMSFVITQSSSDLKVLNYIKDNLHFGKIIIQSKKQNTHRYIVQNMQDINLICELFNGNMVFPTRRARFLSFLSFFNERLLKKNEETIPVIFKEVIPSLNDCWLLGITDGEGCFSSSILSNSYAFRIRYILTQKWDANKTILSIILNLFEKNIGSIVPHSVSNVWELRINGVKNCEFLLNYFDKYTLKTNKRLAYLKWKDLLYRLKNKEHLYDEKRLILKELSKEINKNKGKKDVI